MELSEILRIHELWVKWFTWKKYSRDNAKNRKQSRQILLVATHLLKFLGIFKAVEQKGDPNQMIKFGLQHSICFGIISPFVCEVRLTLWKSSFLYPPIIVMSVHINCYISPRTNLFVGSTMSLVQRNVMIRHIVKKLR